MDGRIPPVPAPTLTAAGDVDVDKMFVSQKMFI